MEKSANIVMLSTLPVQKLLMNLMTSTKLLEMEQQNLNNLGTMYELVLP